MTIQSSLQIGQVIRNAVAFNVRNWHGGITNTDPLIRSVQDFFDALKRHKVSYALVGDIAVLHYIEGSDISMNGVENLVNKVYIDN